MRKLPHISRLSCANAALTMTRCFAMGAAFSVASIAVAQTPKSTPAPAPAPAPPPAPSRPAPEPTPAPKPAAANENKPVSHPGATREPEHGQEHKPDRNLDRSPDSPAGSKSEPGSSARPASGDTSDSSTIVRRTTRNGDSTTSTDPSAGRTRVTSPGIHSSLVPRGAMPDSPEAVAKLQTMNAARARLSGVNHMPIPSGRVISLPDGRLSVSAGPGRSYSLRADGTLASYRNRGESATFRPNGKLVSLNTKGLSIHIGSRGERVIIARHADNSSLVSTGPHSGYYESAPVPFNITSASYSRTSSLIHRVYISGNRSWQRTYLTYNYQGRTLKQFVPAHTYAAAFYGWAWRTWPQPILYRWIWLRNRWYLYYRNFYMPWPTYSGASYWLTDYFLAETLDDGYDSEQPDDGGQAPDPDQQSGQSTDPQTDPDTAYAPVTTPISHEIKLALASEVQQQLAMNSANPPTRAFDSNGDPVHPDPNTTVITDTSDTGASQFLQAGYVFVVNAPTSVTVSDPDSGSTRAIGTSIREHCSVGPGDVLRLTHISVDSGEQRPQLVGSGASISMADSGLFNELEVMASLRGDCPAGFQVQVPTTALQEMENNFESRLDDGMQVLFNRQGKDNLPPAPAAALQPVDSTSPTAPADPSSQPATPSPADLTAQLQALLSQAKQTQLEFTQTMLTAQAAPTPQ